MRNKMKASTFNFCADLIGLRKHAFIVNVWFRIMKCYLSFQKIISISTCRDEARESKWKNNQGTEICVLIGHQVGMVVIPECVHVGVCMYMQWGRMVRSEQAPLTFIISWLKRISLSYANSCKKKAAVPGSTSQHAELRANYLFMQIHWKSCWDWLPLLWIAMTTLYSSHNMIRVVVYEVWSHPL